jgi:LmbE family N-acetylglucosaminyl deacetylase
VPLDGLESQMIGLKLPAGHEARRVLCIGAHCDDIEIGCAGTLLQLQKAAGELTIDWIVLTGDARRQAEAAAAMQLLVGSSYRGELVFGGFPDSRLPTAYGELKGFFDTVRQRFRPDVVFCHAKNDAHQDHRLANEMAWGAFRDHLILEYEIVKWDGDLGQPNTYVPLDADSLARKVDVLMETYGTQRNKDWFTPETFRAMARIRGVECRSPTGHAEAFFARKLVVAV